MIKNPEKLVFETQADVIDYVTKGLPPTRKQYQTMLSQVNMGVIIEEEDDDDLFDFDDDFFDEEEPEIVEENPGKRAAYIDRETGRYVIDDDEFFAIIDRVYANRIRNRNIALGVGGLVVAGLIFGVISHHNDEKEDK